MREHRSLPGVVGITGATGFVGMWHTAARCAAGLPTRLLVRGSHPWATRPPKRVEVVIGDLHQPEALRRFCAGLDGIAHYAARASYRASWEQLAYINIEGTRQLVAAAKEVPRLVCCSTTAVMIRDAHLHEVDESLPPREDNPDPYGRSKHQAEQLALQGHPGAVVLRPPWVWGPGDTNNLPTVLQPALQGVLLEVDRGRYLAEQLHAATLVRQVEGVLATPSSAGRTYFATDPKPRTYRQFRGLLLSAARLSPRLLSVPGVLLPALYQLDRRLLRGALRLSPGLAILGRREQTFSDAALRALLGDLEVVTEEEATDELRAWLDAVGGAKVVATGRKQGAAEALIQDTWRWLLEESVSLRRVAATLRPR